MSDLEFPFEYREGQRKIVSGVYHTISTERQIFVQAPTGVGKTMSTIFPFTARRSRQFMKQSIMGFSLLWFKKKMEVRQTA